MSTKVVTTGAFARPGKPERPTTPNKSYGVPQRGGEKVDWDWVREQLLAATDYWVATVRPNGHPHAAPIWGCMVDDDLFLETDPQTLKARNWARDPRAVVHIGGGSAVVIVEGRVHPHVPNEETGVKVAAAMKGKYEGYAPEPHDWDGGGLFQVLPDKVLAWREMNTATRFTFKR